MQCMESLSLANLVFSPSLIYYADFDCGGLATLIGDLFRLPIFRENVCVFVYMLTEFRKWSDRTMRGKEIQIHVFNSLRFHWLG